MLIGTIATSFATGQMKSQIGEVARHADPHAELAVDEQESELERRRDEETDEREEIAPPEPAQRRRGPRG